MFLDDLSEFLSDNYLFGKFQTNLLGHTFAHLLCAAHNNTPPSLLDALHTQMHVLKYVKVKNDS